LFEDTNPNKDDPAISNVNFKDPHFYEAYGNPESAEHEIFMSYMFHLAVCHTVII